MECTRWHKNQQAYLEIIWKENKTDDVICLHFGVYGNICGHMIPSSVYTQWKSMPYAKGTVEIGILCECALQRSICVCIKEYIRVPMKEVDD